MTKKHLPFLKRQPLILAAFMVFCTFCAYQSAFHFHSFSPAPALLTAAPDTFSNGYQITTPDQKGTLPQEFPINKEKEESEDKDEKEDTDEKEDKSSKSYVQHQELLASLLSLKFACLSAVYHQSLHIPLYQLFHSWKHFLH